MTTGDHQDQTREAQAMSRQASVTLRSRGQSDDPATQLDPANQSLAEALKLVFRLLQIAMVVLFGVFALSGFQSIKESEKGIRLLFGSPSGDSLQPGFQFSLPYPLGELIKVDTGAVQVHIDDAFWPRLTDEQKRLPFAQLVGAAGKTNLKPGEDGTLITGDGKLVHARWRTIYTRQDPVRFIKHVSPGSERNIVRAAVQRGVVQAVAEVTMDEFLKQSSEQGTVAIRAREIAQATLDRIESGIDIQMLTLEEKIPPFWVYNDFAGVQAAEQQALQARLNAESQANETLHAMAGGAHEYLVNQIDLYEQAIALEDVQEQERIMETIRALMDGRPVEIDGQIVERQVSGQVTSILNDASSYRSTIVSQRQGELKTFQAKLQQFRRNPDLVIQREWADAMTAFLDHDYVEVFNVPPGLPMAEMWINRDIDYQRKSDQLRKEREQLQQMERRQRDQQERRFKTNTDVTTATEM